MAGEWTADLGLILDELETEIGELVEGLEVELAADLIVGPIAVALFFKGGKPSPRMVEPIIDLALRGLRR